MLCNRKVSRVKNTNLFNQFDDVSDTFWEKSTYAKITEYYHYDIYGDNGNKIWLDYAFCEVIDNRKYISNIPLSCDFPISTSLARKHFQHQKILEMHIIFLLLILFAMF
uniref:Uncharacterized protein n=1 Tax=Rhizophagus irregularis (strain DAOM 181602 / DAOM 197198 / MUCL 43194) TaxID=747089 RepID=U9TJF9_RHIID